MKTNEWLRNGIIVGLFALPFIPLIVSESMFFPFITGKNFAFRIITEIVFALWLVLAFRDARYRPRRSWILGALAAFLAIVAVADLFGVNPSRSFWSNYERMEGLVTHLHLFALFLVMSSVFTTERLWQWFFHTSLGAVAFTGIFALVQHSGLLVINQSGTRVDATLGNAIYLAVFLMFHIFITVFYLARPKHALSAFLSLSSLAIGHIFAAYYLLDLMVRARAPLGAPVGLIFLSLLINVALYFILKAKTALLAKIYYLELVVLEVAVLYYTATRGAMLGLIGGLFLAAALYGLRAEAGSRGKRAAIAACAAIVILVGGFIALRDASFIKNNQVLGRFASISLAETTTQSRFLIWKNISWNGFKERPILGWGQENFNTVFSKYYVPELWKQEPWFDRSHNVFFDWAISAGILGFLAYIAIFAAALRTIFSARAGRTFSQFDQSILVGMFAGYFVQNLTVFDNLTSYLMFFFVLAYLAYETDAEAGKNRSMQSVAVPAVVAVGLLAVLYFINIPAIRESRTLIRSVSLGSEGPARQLQEFKKALSYRSFGDSEAREQLVAFAAGVARNTGIDEKTKKDVLEYAHDEIIKQVNSMPTDARYRFFAGSYFNRVGSADEAVEHLEKAVENAPRKQMILFELGAAYINKGRYADAFEVLKRAYEGDPSYADARLFYALAAVYAGQDQLAVQLVGTSTLATDERFMSAYVVRGQFGKVIAFWQSRVESDPKNASHRVSLAAAYLANKQRDLAIRELRKAIELNPEFKNQGEYYIKEIQAGRNP